jgi:hypothetical protein
MRAVITVAITVDVPDGTDLGGLYLGLPADQIELLRLRTGQPVDATVEGYETLNVSGPREAGLPTAAEGERLYQATAYVVVSKDCADGGEFPDDGALKQALTEGFRLQLDTEEESNPCGIAAVCLEWDTLRRADEGDGVVPAAIREALQDVLHYTWADEKEDARHRLRENGDLTGHVFADLVALDNWLHATDHTPESYLTGEDDLADPCCRAGVPVGACIQVEYDRHYTGGDYNRNGQFAYVPCELVGRLGSVEAAFRQLTGHDPVHIVHYDPDELYTTDGKPLQG